ncbi:hypothetical protein EXIGLDRAFT_761626 [Exidia glandulosa HHB12029]|uniref:Uncharacterized protein n=1 Tax=Exidia glandulosa HHB12029 TaxID=1314781 RepID=A0A165NCD6_EXIGL|nr:hypothetical protein EXIGLDRAFT_761626 [Exidia glandulosa HHB12029]
MLQFATWYQPQDFRNPVNVFQPTLRAAVDTSVPNQWRFSWVPSAQLAPGVLDEGEWPRYVMLDGREVLLKRDEWDALKLQGTHFCMIPQKGFPIAQLIRSNNVPELDSDSESDTSSEGTATPRAVPSTPVTNVAELDNDLYPGSPMQSVVSRLPSIAGTDAMSVDAMSIVTRSSKMSVDSERTIRSHKTVRSNASSNLAPNRFGKRAKAPSCEHPAEREAKRFHRMRDAGRYEAHRARRTRQRQRQEYERQRRAALEEEQVHRLMAEEALRRQDILLAELHAQELDEKRRRLAEMDAVERVARARFDQIEKDRAAAARALADRRMQPVALPAKEAFEVWEARVKAYNQLRRQGAPIFIGDIPFPVLFRPEYSLHLVNEQSVAAFFVACAQFITPKMLKGVRVLLHPDHFTGRQYVAGLHYEDEAETAFVVDRMKVVSAYVNDNLVRQ